MPRLVWPFAALLPALLTLHGAAPPARDSERLFSDTVWPVLQRKCLGCHGDDPRKIRGGLDLRTRDGLLKGGESGLPAVVPGQPSKSPLYTAVTRHDPLLVMPPKETERLDAAQIDAIRRWIAAGAPWSAPRQPATAKGIRIATSSGRSREWTERLYRPEDVWAYQPVRPVQPPDGGHPIDAFLDAARRARGIDHTAPPADRRTLVRRVTFDLTGLPPTPAEVDAFLADARPDAYERLVDRLLASPHYGEQWARHWLDVTRYADTAGFSNDHERPAAWRYRDWVVRALNADMPYDRFARAQLAGDEIDPDDPEMLLAVGFLRMGPWEHTGMSVAAVTRQQFLDDVTHSVGATFLAQPLRCAACHDHKFDPIPTLDYYRLQAVFAPTQFAERSVGFLPAENTAGFADSRAAVRRWLKHAEDALAVLKDKSDRAIAAELKRRGVTRLADIPEAERPKRNTFGLSKGELSLLKLAQKRADYFRRELLRYEPYALSVYNGPLNAYNSNRLINPVPAKRAGPVPVVRILPGGGLETPAEAVTPGVLSAAQRGRHPIPNTTTGRRRALADWIASRDNPLTARVIVNRAWQHHFGKGLVATSGNFGKMGARPSHPDLLDWLAGWFVDQGWSLKRLHRLILTSAAYRQAGGASDRRDPKNDLLTAYPPRRLAAEEMRDALLAVSGELSREAGGPGVFPEINWEVALQPRHTMGSVAPAYVPSPLPGQRNRRTLYCFRRRTLDDPVQEVLNRPGSESACDCRDQTIIAPQALALFNSDFAHARALALADRLTKQSDKIDEQVRLAFHLCHGRSPTATEARRCADHVRAMTAHHERHPPAKTSLPTKVQRRKVEEMTGEAFEWEEELDLSGYVRDLQPWQVGAGVRGLAELCLVLFNANEFVYVR